MKKLRLDLNALHVETFDTLEDAVPFRGTVPAHAASTPDVCITDPLYCLSNDYTECNSCLCSGGANSCDYSCESTCAGITCDASCFYGTCPPECYD